MATKQQVAGSTELSSLPTATGLIARAAYARCIKESIKADPLLRKVGLSHQQIKGLRGIEWVNVGSEGRRKLCIA